MWEMYMGKSGKRDAGRKDTAVVHLIPGLAFFILFVWPSLLLLLLHVFSY